MSHAKASFLVHSMVCFDFDFVVLTRQRHLIHFFIIPSYDDVSFCRAMDVQNRASPEFMLESPAESIGSTNRFVTFRATHRHFASVPVRPLLPTHP